MAVFDVRSDVFREAVIRIQRRAERQELEEKLSASFVPTRVLDELQTDQNQLIFGRRGVGKTHTLKVYLGKKVQEGNLAAYIDCTTFGSGLASDGSVKNVGIRFFSKFVSTLASSLLEQVMRLEMPDSKKVDELLDTLGNLSEQAIAQSSGETFHYQRINELLARFMGQIGTDRGFIIVDEWAQIPIDAQPYFAEFMKRSVFAVPKLTLKVGVVDYSYRLSENIGGNTIGLEKSADIFSDIRMDTHFVWAEDAEFVENFFAELLYNHVALDLGVSLDISAPNKVKIVRSDLFTQDKPFSELCRASEGNARDFLVMFGRAYADFRKQAGRERIGLPDVQRAAINWYREDKLSNIATEVGLEAFIKFLIDDVISNKKARAFMVPVQAIQHPLLRRLFSARVLHPLNVEWSHPDKPGERYSLVSIDYGTYASFKGTRNEPDENLFWEIDNAEKTTLPPDLVPLKNDRRSIRRIVIMPEQLDKYWKPK